MIPPIFSWQPVDGSDANRFSTRQCDNVLASARKDTDPCSSDTSFGQLFLASLHFAIGARFLEGKLAQDLLAELRDGASPSASCEPSPWREPIVPHLVSAEHESCVSHQPSHYRQLKVQLQPQPGLQSQDKPPHDADHVLSGFLSSAIRLRIIRWRIAQQRLFLRSGVGNCALQSRDRGLAI